MDFFAIQLEVNKVQAVRFGIEKEKTAGCNSWTLKKLCFFILINTNEVRIVVTYFEIPAGFVWDLAISCQNLQQCCIASG